MPYTDHTNAIHRLREEATSLAKIDKPHEVVALDLNLAADLLELHDKQGLSLDDWKNASDFVTRQVRNFLHVPGWIITKNGA